MQAECSAPGAAEELRSIHERVALYGGSFELGARRRRLDDTRPAPVRDGARSVSLGVLIADDQPLLRKGFRMILEEEPDIPGGRRGGQRRPGRRALFLTCFVPMSS